MKDQKLFKELPLSSQTFLEMITDNLPFTFQETRILITIETDLLMWQQRSMETIWDELKKTNEVVEADNLVTKNRFFKHVNKIWNGHKESLSYGNAEANTTLQKHFTFKEIDSGEKIFGMCPVASEKTICCNLKTIDPIQNCGYGCNYCCIQSFYPENTCYVEQNLKSKLDKIEIDSNTLYHFGTGQSSDSLMWGNKNGVLDDLCAFAKKHPNIFLEFKTKSQNVNYFLDNIADIPKNIVCSWTLNTPTIITEEELGTATLEARINAALKIAQAGRLVAFHFHPIIHYQNWKDDYSKMFNDVKIKFNPSQIAFISFGTLTYTKPVIKQIRLTKKRSRVLQMPLADAAGKLSYPEEIKKQLFKFAYNEFSEWKDHVFFYLCMEERKYWEATFQTCYANNESFENALATAVINKTRKLK